MFSALLAAPFFERLNLWFVAALAAVALYWLGRVAWAARRRQRPAAAWWGVVGWLCLLLAPLNEVPALFGLGAAALLLTDWWPRAFVAASQRPSWGWGLLFFFLGLGLLLGTVPSYLAVLVGLGALLGGAAQLLAGLLWPRWLPVQRSWLPPSALGKREAPTFGSEWRWRVPYAPDPPELNISVGQGYLLLHNVSGRTLHLRGWSSTHRNGFWALDKPLSPATEQRLMREPQQWGVRVWYTSEGYAEVRLLRADWHEELAGRTLN